MLELCSVQLKLYSSVKEMPVDWLWYPYIPFGKVTLLQGDPGGGKSTLMLDIISKVSNGAETPDGQKLKKPMNVIYQCSEDGAADTIKPRLLKAGADCSKVAFIDEELVSVTMDNEQLRRAIADFNAKLLILDPFQAYLGDADLANVTGVRRMLRQLGFWAAAYDCAIVLIGHLNKKQGTRDIYRGLGSIDLVAAARSVLQVDRCEDSDTKILRHIKSSLAPRGRDLLFDIDATTGVKWLDTDMSGFVPAKNLDSYKQNKQEKTAEILRSLLADGPVKATEVKDFFIGGGVSEKTLMLTKKILGIESYRKDGSWYWKIPNRQ